MNLVPYINGNIFHLLKAFHVRQNKEINFKNLIKYQNTYWVMCSSVAKIPENYCNYK